MNSFPISFLSPQYLWLLLAIPLAVVSYLALLRRRKRAAVRYGNFGMLKRAAGTGSRIRRHLPPALFLTALTLMILGIARPAAILTGSSHKSTVILAMDVSGSMSATDVKPTRIGAMKKAAKAFVKRQPDGVIIGVVAFSGSAFLVQPPTGDHAKLDAAIDRLQVAGRTAIGSGILTSLSALFPDEDFGVSPFDNRRGRFYRPGGPYGRRGPYGGGGYYGRGGLSGRGYFSPGSGGPPGGGHPLSTPPGKKFVPVPPGSDRSAVVILLTDGVSNTGPDPIVAAETAAKHGVRVYTVGFGTSAGIVVGYGGWRMRAPLDQATLKQVADMTHAKYYRAKSAQQLEAVYRVLDKSVVTQTKQTEITSLFTAGAAVFAFLAAALSVLWFSRVL